MPKCEIYYIIEEVKREEFMAKPESLDMRNSTFL